MKRNYCLSVFFVSMCLFASFISCRKESKSSENNTTDVQKEFIQSSVTNKNELSDADYVKLILNESPADGDYSSFSFVLDKFANSSFIIVEELNSKGGIALVNQWKSLINSSSGYAVLSQFYLQNNIDTIQMFDKKAEILGSVAAFFSKNPELNLLDPTRQVTIFNGVFDSLKNKSYRNKNSTKPLVITINNILAKFTQNPNIASKLSMDEVLGCLGSAVASAVTASYGLIRDFVNVINGTNLGWSGIKRLAGSFLQSMGGYGIAGLVGFGACIVWEVFF